MLYYKDIYIYIYFFLSQIVRKEQDVINKRKIFIGGIPLNATEKEIFVAFEQQFGKVSKQY